MSIHCKGSIWNLIHKVSNRAMINFLQWPWKTLLHRFFCKVLLLYLILAGVTFFATEPSEFAEQCLCLGGFPYFTKLGLIVFKIPLWIFVYTPTLMRNKNRTLKISDLHQTSVVPVLLPGMQHGTVITGRGHSGAVTPQILLCPKKIYTVYFRHSKNKNISPQTLTPAYAAWCSRLRRQVKANLTLRLNWTLFYFLRCPVHRAPRFQLNFGWLSWLFKVNRKAFSASENLFEKAMLGC